MVTSQNQLETAFRDGSIPEGSDFKNLIDTIFSRLDRSTADTRYPTKTELSNNYTRKEELTEKLSDYTERDLPEYVTKNILPEYLQDNKYVDDKRLNTDLNNLRTQITSSILDATASLKTDIESLLVNDSGGLIFGHEKDSEFYGLTPFPTAGTGSVTLKYDIPCVYPIVRVFSEKDIGSYMLVPQVSPGSAGSEGNYTVSYTIVDGKTTVLTINLNEVLTGSKYYYLIN